MKIKFDVIRISDGMLNIQGWCLPNTLQDDFFVNVYKNDVIINDIIFAKNKRVDVAEIYIKNYIDANINFGFNISFFYDEKSNYFIKFISHNEQKKIKINKKFIENFNTYKYKKIEYFFSLWTIDNIKSGIKFFNKNGATNFFKKLLKKFNNTDLNYSYDEWYNLTKTTDIELSNQLKNNFKTFFSIVIPVFDTSDKFLYYLFNSLFNQTYQNFEICIVDATDYTKNKNNPKKFFNNVINGNIKFSKSFNINNLKINYINKNISIANNTNLAIDMVKGDYIVLCDHDDELTLDALYENAKVINENEDIVLIYSDEDKIDTSDKSYFEPAFKPDFSIDMLLSVNYICHLTVIKKQTLDELKSRDGFYENEFLNGAQDYDLFLRIANLIIEKCKNYNFDYNKYIYHIKKVLYHWRCHKNSTSKNVNSKNYAFINGQKAIENFYKNTLIDFRKVDHVEKGFDYGLYKTVFTKFDAEPLLTIIIPNKDHIEDLDTAIKSIENGTYKNIQYIICENNSKQKSTFDYYEKLKLNNKIKIIYYNDIFNYSKINNFALSYANSEYILFLNNDVKMIEEDSIFQMMNYIVRSDVGAVGAKLLYSDDTIQHAGVVLGFGGCAGHTFIGKHNFEHTYMNRAHIVQNYNAVTAACLMTKKSLLTKFSAFDEKLQIAFNDIDLCLNIRKLNKLIVYNPYSVFYHYESKSRGYEDTKEKVERFNNETAYFISKWKNKLSKIDEFYNPNLTLRKSDFSLRNLNYEKIGELYKLPTEILNLIKKYE